MLVPQLWRAERIRQALQVSIWSRDRWSHGQGQTETEDVIKMHQKPCLAFLVVGSSRWLMRRALGRGSLLWWGSGCSGWVCACGSWPGATRRAPVRFAPAHRHVRTRFGVNGVNSTSFYECSCTAREPNRACMHINVAATSCLPNQSHRCHFAILLSLIIKSLARDKHLRLLRCRCCRQERKRIHVRGHGRNLLAAMRNDAAAAACAVAPQRGLLNR